MAIEMLGDSDNGTVIDPYNLTTEQYNEIIFGAGWGVLEGLGLSQIEECLTDVRTMLPKVIKAFEGADTNATAAFLQLLALIPEAKQTLATCQAIGPNV